MANNNNNNDNNNQEGVGNRRITYSDRDEDDLYQYR